MRHLNYLQVLLLTVGMILSMAFANEVVAQSFKVDITMSGYESDTLIIGNYFGERQLVRDTIYAKNQKNFTWEGDEALALGTYILLTAPDKQFIQFFVEEAYPKFSIKSNADLSEVSFKNSTDNEIFTDYVSFISRKRNDIEPLQAQLENADEATQTTLYAELDAHDAEVAAMQEQLITKYPQSFTAKTIQSSLPIDYPDPPAELEGRELEVYKFEQYRGHYFDHMDLGDSTLLYTPFADNRINYYVDKLTVQLPDSITNSIDYLLGSMNKESQMFRYYLSKMYNKYVQSKMVGMDGVVVHLADKYYRSGMAPWMDEETLAKILDNADKLKPSLIGAVGRDIQVELQDGTAFKISDLEYEYLVLLFWAPDCGHCTKAMPDMVAFEEAYRDKGVKLLSVCTKYQEKVPNCWASVEEKGMQNFINAVDPLGKSRFKAYYDIRTTPKIFVLDQDRKIIIKGIGAAQLSEVMDDIIARYPEEQGK